MPIALVAFIIVVVISVIALIIVRIVLPKGTPMTPKKQTYIPPMSYPTNTGNAKMDAINAEYNAKMRNAVSNLASSDPKKPKSAAGAMVKGAVVGKVIGGDGGAVVGAMVAKEKHDSENK